MAKKYDKFLKQIVPIREKSWTKAGTNSVAEKLFVG